MYEDLKQGDKIYSFYTHREGVLKEVKWETAIVQWEDGQEELVPLGTLRLIPKKGEIKKAFLNFIRKGERNEKRIVDYFYDKYGERVIPILGEVMDNFNVRVGDIYEDSKGNLVKISSMKDNIVEIEYQDGFRERISKDFLIGNFEKY